MKIKLSMFLVLIVCFFSSIRTIAECSLSGLNDSISLCHTKLFQIKRTSEGYNFMKIPDRTKTMWQRLSKHKFAIDDKIILIL
jgi:hypothetical protein